MRRFSRFLIVSLLSLLPLARGQFELPGTAGDAPRSTASMVSGAARIAAGETFTVAVKLEHPPGWHSYYQNSGGLELPLKLQWSVPDGFTVGPIQWPVPEVKDGFAGKSFIYPGSPVFLVDITAPAALAGGTTATLTAEATWQICSDQCINEEQVFTLKLPVAAKTQTDPAAAETIAKARSQLAAKPADWSFGAQSDGGDIILRIKPNGPITQDPGDFVPDQPFIKAASDGGSIRRDGDAWVLELKRATMDPLTGADIPQGGALSGILLGPRPVAVPETAIIAPPLPWRRYLPVLGGMLLGGLILNLMPCVFPVLGIKIMGFVQQAGENRRKVALHGLIFTLGVLVSFAVLSGVLFFLRATFGWGFQLQEPWVVYGLMLLMFVMGLNMFGLFEMGLAATAVGGSLQTKQGFAGSFFSGTLATIVATPCSGPFLGPAIGVAIGLPALQFFTAFAAMAVGLALPYLMLSLFPRLLALLPRPGAWMESFKQAMSFLLFGTAGYLLWIYAGQIELENTLKPIIGLSLIAVAAWIYGRWCLPYRTRRARTSALILTLAFAAGGAILAKPPNPSLAWEPWSAERVEQLLAKDTPVYIDFTAQWCATCQLNKMRAYTPEVVALMKAKGVVAFKADKTKPNPAIEQALQKFGRTAIPVNVLLAPDREPVIFPALLTPKDLLDALGQL